MIPHNEIRQIILPLSYENSKLLAYAIDYHSWPQLTSILRNIILNNHTSSDNFIIRGKYKNTKDKLELIHFDIHDTEPYFNVWKSFRVEGHLSLKKNGQCVSYFYFVQVFIQFDLDFMQEHVQDAGELVCKRFRKSPNCPSELKVFMKMKYPRM